MAPSRLGIPLAVWFCLAASVAWADVFPCTEAGLDDAIAIGGGPHQLNRCPYLRISATKVISGSLILETDDPGLSTILTGDFPASFRIFHILAGGSLELRRFNVQGGATSGMGGSLWNEGTLVLRESEIWGATAGEGGGGIANAGSLELDRMRIRNNSAAGRGGGLLSLPGSTTTIRDSEISGNSVTLNGASEADGGGFYADGTSDLENATLSGNSAGRNGGGAFFAGGSAAIRFSTFAANTAAGSGGAFAGSAASVGWSLIAGSCAAAVTSLGWNVESPGSSCLTFGQPGDRRGVDASLLHMGSLDWNGGPTLTHRLDPGSVAINAIQGVGCPAGGADQRGAPRPQFGGAACDVGAFEATPVAILDLERLAASGDPDPRGSTTIAGFEGASTTDGHVAFVAVDSSGERSIYLYDATSAALGHVAGTATPVPGGTGTFDFTSAGPGQAPAIPELAAKDGEFAFFFPSQKDTSVPNPRPWLPDRGLYRFAPGVSLSRCAGVGDPIDGAAHNVSLSSSFPGPGFDLERGGIVFEDDHTVGFDYAEGLYRCGGPSITEVMAAHVTLPNGDAIRHVVSDVFAESGAVLFSGLREFRPSGGSYTFLDWGLYEFGSTASPAPLKSPFYSDASDVHRSGGVTYLSEPWGVVSIPGVGQIRLFGQISNDASGSFETSERFYALGGAPSASAVTGSGAVFTGLDFLKTSAFPCSFVFGYSPDIATNLGGVMEPLVRTLSQLDGKLVTCAGFSRDGADGDRLSFVAYFDDGSSALYLATVPEPSVLSALAAGVALVAALARLSSPAACARRAAGSRSSPPSRSARPPVRGPSP